MLANNSTFSLFNQKGLIGEITKKSLGEKAPGRLYINEVVFAGCGCTGGNKELSICVNR